jgi:hypothetical protein
MKSKRVVPHLVSSSQSAAVGKSPVLTTGNDNRLDLQKAIQSIAYLLEWGSDDGPIDENATRGLAYFLQNCCRSVDRLYTQDEIRECGGDPLKLNRFAIKG